MILQKLQWQSSCFESSAFCFVLFVREEKCVEIPEAVDFGGQEEPLALRKREFVERIRSSYGFLVLDQGYISRDTGKTR